MRGSRLQEGKELKFGVENCKLRTEKQKRMEATPLREQSGDDLLQTDRIHSSVEEVLATTPFIDIHTHLYPPAFGGLGLWGIDELLTYHYLEAELFRSSSIAPEHYWEFSKRQQADEIWRVLFVENRPVSEAQQGVIACLNAV